MATSQGLSGKISGVARVLLLFYNQTPWVLILSYIPPPIRSVLLGKGSYLISLSLSLFCRKMGVTVTPTNWVVLRIK